MIDLYSDGFQMLWAYEEFRIIFGLFRFGLLLAVTGVALVAVIHVLYMLGFNSALYRRRSPRPGWNKRFVPAALALAVLLTGLYWLSGRWIVAAP